MRKNLGLTVGIATLAAGIAMVVLSRWPEPGREIPMVVVTASQKTPARDIPINVEEAPLAASSGIGKSTPILRSVSLRMRRDLLASRDWRAFALSAMERPEEGGYFYASYVTNLCSRDVIALRDAGNRAVNSAVVSKGTVSSEMLHAVDRMSAACASFVSGEASDLHAAVNTKAADGRDPLIVATSAVKKALASGNSDKLRVAVSSLLHTGDPLATSVDSILNRVMAANVGPDRKEGHIWFDGKFYGPEDAREYTAVVLASQVATCQQDAPCALDDQLVLTCVSGGTCGMDQMDYVRNHIALAGVDAPTFDRVASLAQAMRTALASGNVGAFVR